MVFQPKKYIEQVDKSREGRDLRPEELVGTGPFKFVRWTRGSLLEMERNPTYFRKGLPYLERLQVAEMPDPDELKRVLGDKVTFVEIGGLGWTGFMPNTTKPPFNSRDLRWALNLALDRKEINALANDGVGRISGPYFGIWDWIYSFDDYWTWPGFRTDKKAEDLAEARRVLERLGFTASAPLRFELLCPTAGFLLRQCEVGREQWKKVGVDAVVLKTDEATRTARGARADFDVGAWTFGAEMDDPDAFNTSMFLPGTRNYGRWENRQWLDLYAKQRLEVNRSQRGQMLKQMARTMHEESAFIGTVRPTLFQGWYSFVQGFVPPRYHHQGYNFEEVWLDR